MGSIVAMIMSFLPVVLLNISAKILVPSVVQDILERVIILGLSKAVELTTNTVDDELVAVVTKRLRGENV